ncbi:nicotinamide mononucleotide transporter family protein [Formicincola oecophyllae]|nr:nicotinamide mononucleotide transporter family protein [Formicincola oecophyllae]
MFSFLHPISFTLLHHVWTLNPLEDTAAVLAAASVMGLAWRSSWAWPVSLLATVLYGCVFLKARLYGDALRHVVYVVATLYGWWAWALEARRVRQAMKTTPVTGVGARVEQGLGANAPLVESGAEASYGEAGWMRLCAPARFSWRGAMPMALVALAVGLLWAWSLQNWTNDPNPWMDGSLSAAALLAQLWTARRYRASWILWAVIDCFDAGLFVLRGLYVTAALHLAYVAMAAYGWALWHEAPRDTAP